jgi:predicted metal-dependent peptidase
VFRGILLCVKGHCQTFSAALSEAKAYLRISAPFFASLCSSSRIEQDDQIPTACVNEVGDIRINRDFFIALNLTERAVLLAHEIMHPAWGVFWRSKSLSHDPTISNIAHDHVINLILSESYPGWSIPGWLCDQEFRSMSYEEVYARVAKRDATPSSATSCTRKKSTPSPMGTIGADVQPDGSGSLDPQRDENRWRERILGAFQSARAMGSVPATLTRAISNLLEPEVDWRDALFVAMCENLGKTRINWALPSRRSDDMGLHIPHEEELGYDVSIAVDTSGSISCENLRRACSEISTIVEAAGGSGRFIVGDASVHNDVPLKEFDADLLQGGGGTDFSPVFKHLEEHPTRLLIYFTDTWGTFPPTPPDFPVIWAVYESAQDEAVHVPFGEIVRIPSE